MRNISMLPLNMIAKVQYPFQIVEQQGADGRNAELCEVDLSLGRFVSTIP